MTEAKSEHNFQHQVDCTYKGEQYSVRDDGTVLRYPHAGKQPRPSDNKWTFGKPNVKTRYLELASVRIHRIVATAFHGVPPTKEHVVDHIDTNRWNNRPTNLRWVTRLENVLLNPITAKRIALACGSIEVFLADPSKFRDRLREPNDKWMCTVSIQEAQISFERMLAWAKSDKRPSGGSLGEWIFSRTSLQNHSVMAMSEDPGITMAKTLNAAQRNWHVSSEFPCCPQEYAGHPIKTYVEKLKIDSVFCRNDIYSSLVSKCAISNDNQSLYVISESKNAIKPWALAKVTYEYDLFVHTSLHHFFTQEGAEKQYCLAQGLEWTGEETVDDHC
ncbi:MAG: HNH endonuclease signature motif containing protein [Bacteroidota bacterium]